MSYQVRLDSFEGPLDLLLHLIDKEEMDIYDIQISKITDQYLEYLHNMQSLKLDVTSEFLVMAATLLSIKSRMLLPKHDFMDDSFIDYEFERDPREELVQRLIEYKRYKLLSNQFKELEIERSHIFTRPPTDISQYATHEEVNPVKDISIYHLITAFERALIKYSYREPVTRVEREELSVKERIEQILSLLKHNNGILHFTYLISQSISKGEIIITFLSILELMKQKQIYCIQNASFDDIIIYESITEGV